MGHPPIPLRPIPIINRVAAGHPAEFTDLDYPAGIADDYIPVPDLPEAPTAAAFAVRVEGESMLHQYHAGEILIVGPPTPGQPRDGDDCVVRLGAADNVATTFKRIFFIPPAAPADAAAPSDPTDIRLVPLNPAFPERTLPLPAISGIYPLMYRLIPAPRHHPPTPTPYPLHYFTI